jgi:deoxyribonuclease-4
MSIAGGLAQALWRGRETGCDVIQIFTKNPIRWRAKPLTQDDRVAFLQARQETGIRPVAAHGSYLINLASPDNSLYEQSLEALREEMQRAETLELPYLVMHPGSPRGSNEEEGIDRIARAINLMHHQEAGRVVMILLETTAGQGATLGNRFEHFARIIARIEEEERVGVCLDTCHLFAAGYDFSTAAGYAATLAEFDQIIGLTRLKVIHVNDAKSAMGSGMDRHEHIGRGSIGLDAFRFLLQDPRLAHLPFILETPKEKVPGGEDWDYVNLRTLRELL